VAVQESKRRRKSGKDSASNYEGASECEFPEFAYRARPAEMQLGFRVEIVADDEEEWDSPNLYGKTAGDLETHRHKRYGPCSQEQDMLD
jgi:hypothetical protein